MTCEPKWFRKKNFLRLHEQSIAKYGGSPGLRDEGLLDSALARPQNTHAYNPQSSLADLAASYAFGIAKNHAFIDGNKRAAFMSIGLFLGKNGYRLVATQPDSIQTILAVASSELDESGLSQWIARNMVPLP